MLRSCSSSLGTVPWARLADGWAAAAAASLIGLPPIEEEVIRAADQDVGEQSDHAHHEDAGEGPGGLGVLSGQLEDVTEPVLAVHNLRQDDVCPGDRVHHP